MGGVRGLLSDALLSEVSAVSVSAALAVGLASAVPVLSALAVGPAAPVGSVAELPGAVGGPDGAGAFQSRQASPSPESELGATPIITAAA